MHLSWKARVCYSQQQRLHLGRRENCWFGSAGPLKLEADVIIKILIG